MSSVTSQSDGAMPALKTTHHASAKDSARRVISGPNMTARQKRSATVRAKLPLALGQKSEVDLTRENPDSFDSSVLRRTSANGATTLCCGLGPNSRVRCT